MCTLRGRLVGIELWSLFEWEVALEQHQQAEPTVHISGNLLFNFERRHQASRAFYLGGNEARGLPPFFFLYPHVLVPSGSCGCHHAICER